MPRKNRGPYIEPNPNTCIYEIRWTERGRSRRRSTGTTDFRQAQKILANFLLLSDRDKAIEPRDDAPTVLRVLGDPDAPLPGTYWHDHVLPKVASKETAEFSARKILAFFGPMAVKDIMPVHVKQFIAKRRSGEIGKPSIDSTIERDLTVLRAAIQYAARHKIISPADVPMIEHLKGSPPRDRWLSKEEAERLLEAAIQSPAPEGHLPRVYCFVAIALGTGSRKTAILELTRQQVDLDRGMIQFNPSGRHQTKKRRPTVPISDWLMPIMRKIVAQTDGDLLLPGGCIRTAFESACERAGLKDVTPHTLRHTWATWAAQAGVPLTDIAAVLGDTYATVEKNYLHHCPEHLRSAVNAIGMAA